MNSQTASIVLSVLIALAGSTVMATIVTTLANRKKLDVDVSKTKADAAATLSTTAIALSTAQGQTIDRLRDAWHVHREWDKNVVKRMRQAGWSDVEDPPDLWV